MEPARTTAPSPRPAGGDAEPPAPAAPSSFAELLRLVRSGQSPPGVRSPRAEPTGDTPTASSLPRPSKPWETGETLPFPSLPFPSLPFPSQKAGTTSALA
uniref:Peroxisomal membrane protein PEX14-like KPWE domain-containing protein n=1 Tax=Anser cygnoides TaxID=8845 RepID=A0A8B9IEP8_ANSCY